MPTMRHRELSVENRRFSAPAHSPYIALSIFGPVAVKHDSDTAMDPRLVTRVLIINYRTLDTVIPRHSSVCNDPATPVSCPHR